MEEPPKLPDTSRLQPLSQPVLNHFAARGISEATLARNGVLQEHSAKHGGPVIAFPFMRDGQIINLKYRTLDKKFWQVRAPGFILHP